MLMPLLCTLLMSSAALRMIMAQRKWLIDDCFSSTGKPWYWWHPRIQRISCKHKTLAPTHWAPSYLTAVRERSAWIVLYMCQIAEQHTFCNDLRSLKDVYSFLFPVHSHSHSPKCRAKKRDLLSYYVCYQCVLETWVVSKSVSFGKCGS